MIIMVISYPGYSVILWFHCSARLPTFYIFFPWFIKWLLETMGILRPFTQDLPLTCKSSCNTFFFKPISSIFWVYCFALKCYWSIRVSTGIYEDLAAGGSACGSCTCPDCHNTAAITMVKTHFEELTTKNGLTLDVCQDTVTLEQLRISVEACQ